MEVCRLESQDNENEIVLRQILREVKELMSTTTARLLTQDGKIAETCVYIKNNLSNSIRELLDTMQNSGELDDIITGAILNEIKLLEDGVYPIGHVKRYGATGDGIHDDTLSILEAIDEAIRYKVPLIAGAGKYKISQDLNMRFIDIIKFEGDIVTDNNSVVTIGGNATSQKGQTIEFNEVPTLNVIGLKNSNVKFKNIETMNLIADGDKDTDYSIAYNNFYGAVCRNVNLMSSGTNIGWINENVFRIKRVESVSMDGNYDHNNNHFEHCNFEKGVLNLNNARNNYFKARCEGGITVNSTDKSQANFIEKEFYYRHYFGDNVTDNNGVISFYPVNKLQVEKDLLQIDSNNKNFPIGSLYFKANGLFNGRDYNVIYKSNLIKIDSSFAIKMKSSSAAFRVQMNFYDENKNRITSEVTNFADGKMTYQPTENFSYMITSNVNNDTVNFFPGEAKYVEYQVIFGSNVSNIDIEYVKVKLIKLVNTDIHITNTIKNNVYTQVPTEGYWEQGQILLGKNPIPGSNIGIICTESGNPGVWKNFAPIQE